MPAAQHGVVHPYSTKMPRTWYWRITQLQIKTTTNPVPAAVPLFSREELPQQSMMSRMVTKLKAELFDGFDEAGGVFLRGVGVDAVSQVHDVVAASTVAQNLFRTFLPKRIIGYIRRWAKPCMKKDGIVHQKDDTASLFFSNSAMDVQRASIDS